MSSFTVPFRSIQQSRVTGLLASPKCHGGHGQFGQVPNLYEDMINKNNKNKNLPPPNQPEKRWCHGHFWHLLKPKFWQACHGSRGLLNWSKWDSIVTNSYIHIGFDKYHPSPTSTMVYEWERAQTTWFIPSFGP
jgi:hypothetical protein